VYDKGDPTFVHRLSKHNGSLPSQRVVVWGFGNGAKPTPFPPVWSRFIVPGVDQVFIAFSFEFPGPSLYVTISEIHYRTRRCPEFRRESIAVCTHEKLVEGDRVLVEL